jgi:predicted patatin/cPLA2 family phospholipase
MALIASIGIEYIDGQVARATAVKEAVDSAKRISTPVVDTRPKSRAKAKKEEE